MTGCTECHGERDFTKYAGPVVAGSEGKGGEQFGDPEIAADGCRTASEHVDAAYSGITREDLGAIYTYLRTLKPIVNRVKKHN